jgi:hypothetical protein
LLEFALTDVITLELLKRFVLKPDQLLHTHNTISSTQAIPDATDHAIRSLRCFIGNVAGALLFLLVHNGQDVPARCYDHEHDE